MNGKSIIAALIIIPVVALAGVFGYVFYVGPRMKEQAHIRSFQSVVPLPPAGTVTVEAPERLPTEEQVARVKNPLSASRENIERGRAYYRYYCVFCHGEKADGAGPVGNSYVPKPADLNSPKIKAYGDGRMLRAMLTGVGHEPVLEQVVPPGQRWYLVLFVRALGQGR